MTYTPAKEYVGREGIRSISDDGMYILSVKRALRDYDSFCKFKQDPNYTVVLEHTTKEQGNHYIDIIRDHSPHFLQNLASFMQNDLIGGAICHPYEGLGTISPSTLRYMKVASDLRKLFSDNIGDTVAEIGIGYGGQLLIADKALQFNQYELFDLPLVLELASRYLESHILNSCYKLCTINQHRGDFQYDLVISNYAFSEFPKELQIMYIRKIISKSKKGYLTMNSGMPNSAFSDNKLTIKELEHLLPPFELLQERPLTHPGNYIIVWGHLNSRL